MVQRNLVLRERMTALIGIALLLALVGLSYYYSIRITLEGLKYVPSLKSPDFIAKDVVVTDFDKDGTLLRRLLSQNVDHIPNAVIAVIKIWSIAFRSKEYFHAIIILCIKMLLTKH